MYKVTSTLGKIHICGKSLEDNALNDYQWFLLVRFWAIKKDDLG